MIFSDLIDIVGGEVINNVDPNAPIQSLIVDSRKPFASSGALFFAIAGERHDGHNYIAELKNRGVKNFIVTADLIHNDANLLKVENAVLALQLIAKFHREQFSIPVIGITGSNGKTIVKEWLYTCLSRKYRIVKSPKSFNSQIGVPLSVWNINEVNNLAIFEAGISKAGEMQVLADIIQPTIGIFTNIGSAHDEGFVSRQEKFDEKAKLFTTADVIIHNGDNKRITFGSKSFTWGKDSINDIRIVEQKTGNGKTIVKLTKGSELLSFKLPFNDAPSIENVMHCITYMLYLQMDAEYIQEALSGLQRLEMRLELKKGINGSYIIDDTYNNDLIGLKQAISFLAMQNQKNRKIVILSDIYQSGLEDPELYSQVADLLRSAHVDQLITVGSSISENSALFDSNSLFYQKTEELIGALEELDLSDSVILIKGARRLFFEKIVQALVEKIHGTVLEINLDALTNNLNYYRSKLSAQTKIMVMVKAFAYGSGSFEIANLLQYHRVDYLGVAYVDEGIQLRKNGIHLPIMVMNANRTSFESLLKYELEPVIYEISLLKDYLKFLNGRPSGIHIEMDTGMHRLGFEKHEISKLITILKPAKNIKVQSIFSHLAGADHLQHTEFSYAQAEAFKESSSKITDALSINPLLHLVNSPGILRFPELHFDMVRLGIGLYGLEANNEEQSKLQNISKLRTVVSQIRVIAKGETVGYGRYGQAEKELTIATIAIGYADGFSRAFSRGVGEVWVNGKRAKVIGNVCMDMTMIDVTGIDVRIGDEVEIFGNSISIKELADKIGTIAYEILTSVSERVKRVYYTE